MPDADRIARATDNATPSALQTPTQGKFTTSAPGQEGKTLLRTPEDMRYRFEPEEPETPHDAPRDGGQASSHTVRTIEWFTRDAGPPHMALHMR